MHVKPLKSLLLFLYNQSNKTSITTEISVIEHRRFATLDEDELKRILTEKNAKNTIKATNGAVKGSVSLVLKSKKPSRRF